MGKFFEELKRRNVVRVGVAYLVVGWIVMQVVDVIVEPLRLPEWTATLVIVLLLIGLPVTLFLAWAYEMTPDGMKSTAAADADAAKTSSTGMKLNYVIIAGLITALGYFVWESHLRNDTDEAQGQAVESAPRHAIAVLPFINLSNDPQQEFFSDGITEELLNVLAKIDGLRVTSRTSAFKFKNTALSVPEIAAELKVQYVLEGSVRRGGGQVRITTQLIDVATDSHLWSETYDRDMSNIFAVQDEIAGRVADALKIALLGADRQPIAPAWETSPQIYMDYLLARQKMAIFAFGPMREAERLLRGVIAADPAFAPAHEALANLYMDMTDIGILSEAEFVGLARPVVDSALRLSDRLASVWLVDSHLRAIERDDRKAQASRAKAHDLQPNHPSVLRDLLLQSYWSRQPTDMSAVIESLIAVDPFSAQTMGSVEYWYSRQNKFEDLRRTTEKLLEFQPNTNVLLFSPAVLPQPEEGNAQIIASLRLFRQANSADPEGPAFLALTLLDAGETAPAERQIRDAIALDKNHAAVAIAEALTMTYRGEAAGAHAIARTLAVPDAPTRWGSRDIARRMLATQALNAGDGAALIPLYLSAYPGLAGSDLTSVEITPSFYVKWGHLMAALDLAALYAQSGDDEKSAALLAAVEAELPFWPRRGVFGIALADAELAAIRGDDTAALAALRQAAEDGWTERWWWFLDHSPHFDRLRSNPEFAAIRADFATRAALPGN